MEKKKKSKLFSFRCLPMDFMRITGLPPGFIWFRPKIRYTSEKAKKRIRGGALVVSNHSSFKDPAFAMLTIWYRRLYFVCHQVLMDSKAGPFFRIAGCLIPINADNFSMDSFRDITDKIEEGKVVVIFPEGHVNSDSMKEFKSGMVLMSMRSRSPIIPIYLKPRKHWYSRLEAVVDEPVDINEMCGSRPSFSKINEISEYIRQREESLSEYLKDNIKKEEKL